MLYQNVELHNVAELVPQDGGVRLFRFPSAAVTTVNKMMGATRGRSATGCEIRFVTDANTVWVTMEAMAHDVALTVLRGDLVYQKLTLRAGGRQVIEIARPGQIDDVGDAFFADGEGERFSPQVWRIYISSEAAHCIFYSVEGLDAPVRPPHDREVPGRRFIAYGSSITHGCWTIDTLNSYPQIAARELGVDVLCKGMAGSCQCEKAISDYLAREECDFATLELGVNMYHLDTPEFESRVRYLLTEMRRVQPARPFFVITPFVSRYSDGPKQTDRQKHAAFVDILHRLTAKIAPDTAEVIDGTAVLDRRQGLCYDCLHPSEYGHMRMGVNLARMLSASPLLIDILN